MISQKQTILQKRIPGQFNETNNYQWINSNLIKLFHTCSGGLQKAGVWEKFCYFCAKI